MCIILSNNLLINLNSNIEDLKGNIIYNNNREDKGYILYTKLIYIITTNNNNITIDIYIIRNFI